MNKKKYLPIFLAITGFSLSLAALFSLRHHGAITWEPPPMTTTSQIITDIDAFIADQNANRGGKLTGGGTLALDYNALTGTIPAGGNAVTGIAGIAAGAAAITLPSGPSGNAVIVDGAISTTASTSSADSYSMAVDTSGTITLTDNNTGNSQTITGASYILFDGGTKTVSGVYQSIYTIETGTSATIAAMFNAAFLRVPDLPGLEFYIDQYGTAAIPNMDALAGDFLRSPEFAKDYPALTAPADHGGVNDNAFVNQLYSGILHRSASASEIAFYDSALAGTLVNSTTGQTIAAVNRATVFEYFTASPENQADISASNGGWLINPANGAVNLGALSTVAASSLLTTEVAKGVVNTADFDTMSNTARIGADNIGIYGANDGMDGAAGVTDAAPNITVKLSSTYYFCLIITPTAIVDGPTNGGAVISILDQADVIAGDGTIIPANKGSGTITLYGNDNWIALGAYDAVAPASKVIGWSSSDVLSGLYGQMPGTNTSYQSLMATQDGVLYQGSSANPVNGATLGAQDSGTWFRSHQVAVNVGAIADDSAATMSTAANLVYKVGDFGTINAPNSEGAFFFGQDPQGNTMVYYWHGDSAHTGTIQAIDMTGAVELVGVQASSITSTNFHR